MNKIQIFYSEDLVELQMTVNAWLEEHKQVKILATNLNSVGKPSHRAGVYNTEKHIFYILYKLKEDKLMAEHEATEQGEVQGIGLPSGIGEPLIAPDPITGPLNESTSPA